MSKCWFCLSNPDVESHMILTVVENTYVAMAKGGLVNDHLLVVPVHHHSSSRSIESLNDGGGLFRAVESEVTSIFDKVSLALIYRF